MDSFNYNFFNTLIFSGIIYGLIFSVVTLLNKKFASSARTFLVITVLCLTLSNLQYWLIDIGFREKYNIPKIVYVQFELLILPFFYLFVRKYLQKEASHMFIFLLMFPFILGMAYQLYTYSAELQRLILRKYNLIIEIATIVYSVILISFSFLEIYKYEKNKHLNFKNIGVSTKWIKYYALSTILVFAIWILSTQIFYSDDNSSLEVYYPLWISISGIIYWMGNKGLFELRIYYERKKIRSKYLNSNFESNIRKNSTSKGSILYQQLFFDLKENKLYLNDSLSLDYLAKKYNMSSGYLSQIISKHSKEGLADIINKLRIEEAKKMLLDKNFDNYTIESIGLESGFGTKANFYKVFKKLTGITPRQYKNVSNF